MPVQVNVCVFFRMNLVNLGNMDMYTILDRPFAMDDQIPKELLEWQKVISVLFTLLIGRWSKKSYDLILSSAIRLIFRF